MLLPTPPVKVAESIPLQEARGQSLEIVHWKLMDDANGTTEDPDAVRSRIGCDTGKHVRPRGCDAGDTTSQGVQKKL